MNLSIFNILCTVWKKAKFSHTEKKIRQINYIVICCEKRVRENFCNFHTVQLWKNQKFTLTEKIFRQINYLVISLVNLLFSRMFCRKSCAHITFSVKCNFFRLSIQTPAPAQQSCSCSNINHVTKMKKGQLISYLFILFQNFTFCLFFVLQNHISRMNFALHGL